MSKSKKMVMEKIVLSGSSNKKSDDHIRDLLMSVNNLKAENTLLEKDNNRMSGYLESSMIEIEYLKAENEYLKARIYRMKNSSLLERIFKNW